MVEQGAIRAAAAAHLGETVAFASRLVRTPSMPGQEGEVAALVAREMDRLGYDRVDVDAAGNVVGLIRGQGRGRSMIFNTHMDHVSPGDRAFWDRDPFSGDVADGYLWGRASTDIKGSMACQVHTLPVLRRAGLLPQGDVWVTAVVMEEIGGLGTQQLVQRLQADSAVVGEPSRCRLMRGHRGRTGLEVRITGKAGHASAPDRAINPHYVAAAFLPGVRDLPMSEHPDFGRATLVPTVYRSDNESVNVIPERVTLHLDWRTVPGEDSATMVARLQALLDAALLPGSTGAVGVVQDAMISYNGFSLTLPSVFPAYALVPDHWAVRAGEAALAEALGRPVEAASLWRFATDGGHLNAAGIPPIGFGPGREEDCHIANERISLAQLEEALIGNAALTLALTAP